jgi:Na+/H+ antiporter NhaA
MATALRPGFTERTAWARNLASPLRDFLTTESGSAVVLLGAALAALVWVNVDASSYDSVWTTNLSIHIGGRGVSQDLRHWVSNGLMAFFFCVVGLEARREFDLGELRDRRRTMVPVAAALGGIGLAAAVYLAFNAGHTSAHGWGTAISTDTAFALGVLTLAGPRFQVRSRALFLTILVVDDLVSLLVIAFVYSASVSWKALAIAAGLFGVVLFVRAAGVRRGVVYLVLGAAIWVAVLKSGVDPVVVGLAIGLLAYAYPPPRSQLELATDRFRSFREQPTPELARSARQAVQYAVSPNERVQDALHPWSSYVFVPLFALANAGIPISASFLVHAFTSPITLGILVGYVVGKPAGVLLAARIGAWADPRRFRFPVGWGSVGGLAGAAGIGFTVSILIANHAFHGLQLREAKAGVLAAAICASVLTWSVFRILLSLPDQLRARLMLGRTEAIVDLADPVDPERDHIRGPEDAPVTLVEYGDYECPYCGRAEPVVRELLADFGDLRYVWRHLPLTDVHPRAEYAAEASEAAAAQGAFWEMHGRLFEQQDRLSLPDLAGAAEALDLDVERFDDDLRRHKHAGRVARDVDGADMSGVTGTPTFFVNGRRHMGAYDIESLSAAVRVARARALVTN